MGRPTASAVPPTCVLAALQTIERPAQAQDLPVGLLEALSLRRFLRASGTAAGTTVAQPEPMTVYTVSDAMTQDPVTISPDDETGRAQTLMHNARIRHLPVVRSGRLMGLITQSDLLRIEAGSVREHMVTNVFTTTPQTPLRHAARLMFREKIGCLPVLDHNDNVVGVLTETDFIRFAAEMATEFDRLDAAAKRIADPVTHG